mmetsp:Transcript_33137/g.69728  ORF Transcript_33137/g.69728 Transcript_33137/m.69728 type:complete len:328 (+) Transcript_33137:267-1250(+)
MIHTQMLKVWWLGELKRVDSVELFTDMPIPHKCASAFDASLSSVHEGPDSALQREAGATFDPSRARTVSYNGVFEDDADTMRSIVVAHPVPLLLPCERLQHGKLVPVAHDKSAHCGSSIEQPVAEAAPNSAMANVDAAAENNMPIIHERDAHNRMDEEIAMDSHEVGPRAAPAARSKRIRRRDILTYYVCTLDGCGWSGSTRQRHKKARPQCDCVPCAVWYKPGEDRKEKVREFLASCTAEQRQHGLPPDGARAVAAADKSKLYVTVPSGLSAGDHFVVSQSFNRQYRVLVPAGLQGGDVIAIDRDSGAGEEEDVEAAESVRQGGHE